MKIIEILLKKLGVKFTKEYLGKLYNGNPSRNTLFGISNILSEYGIKHVSFKVKNTEEVKSIAFPFIANFEGKIILVDQLRDGNISFLQEDQRITIPFDHFVDVWDRIVLVAELSQNSGEPDYKKHRKWSLFLTVRRYVFIFLFLLLIIIGLDINSTYCNCGIIALLVLNIIGIYISWLLVQKQLHIPNNHADKICSLLKKGNCNSVLSSSAAKIMGMIGWSEIGLSYFISNLFIVVVIPYLIPYLALINIVGLPYSFWSVWYQKYKIKRWCPLCLVVQILLWIVFVVNLFFTWIIIPHFTLLNVILTGCIYIAPLLIINALLPKLEKERYAEYLEDELCRLKLKPEVFKALIYQQPRYKVDFSTSKILWGNKDANVIITIVTNPHCYYCAKMHEQVENLLIKTNSKVCVQYIFFPIKEKYESSNNFLVSVFLSDRISEREKNAIYDKWFKEGRMNQEEFLKNYNVKTDQEIVQSELQNHEKWEGLKSVDGTPTIFINGYQLPYQYGINDLIYFLDLEI